MLLGQKVFHDVAEALQSDAQGVKCDLGAVAQRAAMQFVGFSPTLQREVLKHEASRPYSGRTAWEGRHPSPPLLSIELLQRNCCLLLEAGFTRCEELEQRVADWVIGIAQVAYPLLHHLSISQLS